MSLLDDTPVVIPPVATSTGVTPRTWWRRNRVLALLALLLVTALVLLALTTGVGTSGTLDSQSYEPSGGRALATLLEQQGIHVQRTTDLESTVAGATHDTTIFVPTPEALSEGELQDLAGAGAHLVVANPEPQAVSALSADADFSDLTDNHDVEPGCTLDAAISAGTAYLGGIGYDAHGEGAQTCYRGLVASIPDNDLVLLGGATALTNEHLDRQGNAELGLQLLGSHRDLRWFVPDPDRAAASALQPRSLNDLLPEWVKIGALQLLIATVVLGLWRARRLGRVVVEPLPIVVRAAETVEGRGRLYRAAGSRGTAAESLRSGARDQLSQRLGGGRGASPETVVELIAGRTSRPATQVHDLLYGPPPVDDAALVRLASELDSLILEVAGS